MDKRIPKVVAQRQGRSTAVAENFVWLLDIPFDAELLNRQFSLLRLKNPPRAALSVALARSKAGRRHPALEQSAFWRASARPEDRISVPKVDFTRHMKIEI